MPQWEKVPEKGFDATGKIASMKGNFLRLPVYRVKTDTAKGMTGSKTTTQLAVERPRLTSSVNFANRESTQASWQLDDVYDPMTNGNFTRTEMTQVGGEWNDFSNSKPKVAASLSSINLSRAVHDPIAPQKVNHGAQFSQKQTKSFARRETVSKMQQIVS